MDNSSSFGPLLSHETFLQRYWNKSRPLSTSVGPPKNTLSKLGSGSSCFQVSQSHANRSQKPEAYTHHPMVKAKKVWKLLELWHLWYRNCLICQPQKSRKGIWLWHGNQCFKYGQGIGIKYGPKLKKKNNIKNRANYKQTTKRDTILKSKIGSNCTDCAFGNSRAFTMSSEDTGIRSMGETWRRKPASGFLDSPRFGCIKALKNESKRKWWRAAFLRCK